MTQSNGQQRPANPNRITIWHAKPFPDGRPPASEFSVSAFISLDMLRQLYDAVASGLLQPENNYQGVPGIQLWGNGYRGNPGQNGAPGPVLGGTLNTPKVIWQQQQQAPQQQQPQVAPAYAQAFPPQQQPAPAPAAAPQAAPAPVPAQQGWGAPQAAPAANQWASEPPAF